jgi:RNA methyltransferase, TrmH family
LITSVRNPKIQWVRRLQSQRHLRQQEGLFVVEGVRLVEEALQAGWPAKLVLYTQNLSERGRSLLAGFEQRGSPVEETAAHVLASASDTRTQQGILAVLEQRQLDLPEAPTFVLVVDALRDPGNLGALLRTAAAAGVQALLLTPGTVDPFAPKVVRSAMGAHFRLPLRVVEWDDLDSLLPPGMHVFLADSTGGSVYTEVDFRTPLALIVGGEAEGASDQAGLRVQRRIHIPMTGQVESLNAAVATAVILFEVCRQRKLPPSG